MDLVVNARDAMPRGGKLVISTANLALESPFVERELTMPPGRYATLKVVDNGCGMDEPVRRLCYYRCRIRLVLFQERGLAMIPSPDFPKGGH